MLEEGSVVVGLAIINWCYVLWVIVLIIETM